MEATRGCALVFADPDNGLESGTPRHHLKGTKYASFDELIPHLERGQSLVVYHHLGRNTSAENQISRRLSQIGTLLARNPSRYATGAVPRGRSSSSRPRLTSKSFTIGRGASRTIPAGPSTSRLPSWRARAYPTTEPSSNGASGGSTGAWGRWTAGRTRSRIALLPHPRESPPGRGPGRSTRRRLLERPPPPLHLVPAQTAQDGTKTGRRSHTDDTRGRPMKPYGT